MINSGFAFVASHVKVVGKLPVSILPGYIFRKAREHEIDLIRGQLAESSLGKFSQWVQYEGFVRKSPTDNGHQVIVDKLPYSEWKYWVVAFESPDAMLHEIEKIGMLLPAEIEFAFRLHFSEADQSGDLVGIQMVDLSILEKYTSPDVVFENAASITSEQLSEIGELWRHYKSVPNEFSFVVRALDNYYHLRRVSRYSNLLVVGLFSIIESIVTHKPENGELRSSINNQIKNKMILLRKEYSTPVLHVEYFKTCKEAQAWAWLYEYRSLIAHGDNYKLKEQLRDHGTVVRFLRDHVKQLLTFALKNPEFVSDLRNC